MKTSTRTRPPLLGGGWVEQSRRARRAPPGPPIARPRTAGGRGRPRRARGGRWRGWRPRLAPSPGGPRRCRAPREPMSSCTHHASSSSRGRPRSTMPRRASACSRVSTPTNLMSQLSAKGRDASMRSSPPSVRNADPTTTRSGRLLTRETTTSPASPCGLPTRPTSSKPSAPAGRRASRPGPSVVDEVDVGVHPFA